MAAFTTAAISMVGLPPLAGFFSKWYLALGTIDNSNWLLLAVILISSLLNAVYFFRILEKVYLNNPEAESPEESEVVEKDEVGFSMMFPMAVMAIGLLLVGIFNAYIVNIIFNMFPAGF